MDKMKLFLIIHFLTFATESGFAAAAYVTGRPNKNVNTFYVISFIITAYLI